MNAQRELKRKARLDRAEIDTIVSDYRQSGLTQVDFARQRGLNVATFRSWLAKGRSATLEGFCAVTVGRDSLEELTVRLPGGDRSRRAGRGRSEVYHGRRSGAGPWKERKKEPSPKQLRHQVHRADRRRGKQVEWEESDRDG